MQQRGFSNEILDVIQSYGRINKAPGGAIKIFFGKKEGVQAINELKQKIKLIERAIGRSVIMSERNIITMYKSNKA